MKSFTLTVGQSHRRMRVEPGEQPGIFKLYAAGLAEDWIDYEQSPSVGLPPASLLGIMRVRDETDFDFEGSGAFTGQDLQSVAAQIVSIAGLN